MYTVADGKNPCSEETIILDAEVCEMAAIELSLTFVSKFEDKTSRMGCFLSEGFGGGVYYNSHEDASYSDDKDYKSVCKTEMEMTAEPTSKFTFLGDIFVCLLAGQTFCDTQHLKFEKHPVAFWHKLLSKKTF
jgi:hypothetical protein